MTTEDLTPTIHIIDGKLKATRNTWISIIILSRTLGMPRDRIIAGMIVADVQRIQEVSIEGFEMLDRIGLYLCDEI